MQPVAHGLSRDAERLFDILGRGPKVARLQNARGLQLIEVTPQTAADATLANQLNNTLDLYNNGNLCQGGPL
jgi:hypothetical protein